MIIQEVLTKKEKEEIKSLKRGFNIVKESDNIIIQSANRVEISRKWAHKLLKLSLILNVISIICFIAGTIFVILKPVPDYYGSTPSGRIIGPLSKIKVN